MSNGKRPYTGFGLALPVVYLGTVYHFMKKYYVYILLATGFIALEYFLDNGRVIVPVKELWFSVSLFAIAIAAVVFVNWRANRVVAAPRSNEPNDLAERLKRTGEVVRVTLDNCEVKSRSWQQEVTGSSWPSELEMLDALQGRNYKTEEIRQTYLVVYKDYNGRRYKFVSDAIAHDEVTVRMLMDREGGFNLYVDKANPADYYFDMPAF